jgi:hypothetical protein
MALAKGRLAVPLKIFTSQLRFRLKRKIAAVGEWKRGVTLTATKSGARIIWRLTANPPATHNQIILIKLLLGFV